ncbi:CPBP family intramembrane metalloprotease [Halocynthiibacter sp. C4]|uniref:CPBP family intramembrane glutamic endopeptidase n=1 Tax=Halocynthiibacter sp. C4 TaxID=2992758 RepID=UPI00237C2303|nr:CPBP family intramembrane glutamic endopeptidase [Halocynthiibacter sp. C4]MDE0588845.1 CPBP family intramembrane metalloprotease [Halocynthiibacter sp. C4]
MIVFQFLALTFTISLLGFACIFVLPFARSPDNLKGLPFWLVMVWGPSLAAMILAYANGNLLDLLGRAVRVSGVPMSVWLLVLSPLVVLFLMRKRAPEKASKIGVGALVGMVVFNLLLGPLGEELGWRGFMQEHLTPQFGWLVASLAVGLVWAVWHLPLWAIDSPHAKISLPAFLVHVMLYSVIIGAAYTLSGGSILPAILLHLTLNLASNLAVNVGYREPSSWFHASMLPYAILAIGSVVLVFLTAA